jgi:hypothetical protein
VGGIEPSGFGGIKIISQFGRIEALEAKKFH